MINGGGNDGNSLTSGKTSKKKEKGHQKRGKRQKLTASSTGSTR